MKDGIATLNVDPEIINTIVRKHVEGAVLAALGGGKDAVGTLVEALAAKAMNVTREQMGEVRSYESTAKQNYFEHLAMKSIRAAAKDELQAYMEELRPFIREAVRARLGKTKDNLVKQIAEKMAVSFTEDFRVSVHFARDEE